LQIGSAGDTKKDKVQYFRTIGIMPKSLKPSKILTGSFDNDIELSYDFKLEEWKPLDIALIGFGSFSSGNDCLREFRFTRDNHSKLVQETESSFKRYSSSILTTRSPPAEKRQSLTISKLIRAYKKAKTCLQYLKAEYDGLGEGISAGLPRFPNYWARETGWSLRGYIALGDYRFALSVIDNFLKHQTKKTT
jgi:hypothetical protein